MPYSDDFDPENAYRKTPSVLKRVPKPAMVCALKKNDQQLKSKGVNLPVAEQKSCNRNSDAAFATV
jgi:hypothetical protein